MKKLFAILVIVSLFSHLLFQVGMVTWYELNKDYITKKYCVNKDKPQMKCCGKCYLKKQLKKTNGGGDVSDRSGNTKTNENNVPLFLASEYIIYNCCNHSEKVQYLLHDQTLINVLHERSIFHPPRFRNNSVTV